MISIAFAVPVILAAILFADKRPRQFIFFLLCVGTLQFGAESEYVAVNLSALWLAGLSVLCIAVSMSLKFVPLRGPEKCYLAFLGWCVVEAFLANSSLFAMRLFLKLLYPFLVMRLAHQTLASDREIDAGMKWVFAASFVASLFVGGFTQRFAAPVCWTAAGIIWACAAFADHTAILGVAALAYWRIFRPTWALSLGIWYGISPVLVGIRTGIGAFAIGGSALALLTARKSLAIPVIVGLYLLAGASILLVPSMREHMFFNPDAVDTREALLRPDKVSIDNIDSSGRFAMWKTVLDKFFWPNPALGSGLGATQHWFYSGGFGPRRVKVEHSEYVRLLSDTGIVGLGLFLLTIFSSIAASWQAYRHKPRPVVRFLAVCVVASFPALLFCMGFDNVLNYVLPATQYPFAFVGLLFGLQRRGQLERHSRRNFAERSSGSPQRQVTQCK
jgi:hypothetical protein